MRRGLAAALLVAGCTGDAYVVVTVDSRPAVHGATTLKVTLANDTTSQTDLLQLGSNTFPTSFSISTSPSQADFTVTVDAVDANELLVGRGTTTASGSTRAASVMLDGADFVVNTDVVNDQFMSNDFEANGFQMAATTDGTWIAAYRDDCQSPCNMFARRFDAGGLAVSSTLAAGTNGFPVSMFLTDALSTPAAAASAMNTIVVWDFDDTTAVLQGVSCRAIDRSGAGTSSEIEVATDVGTDVVSATPLSNGNFALTWTAVLTTQVVRSAIVKPDCSTAAAAATVSQATGGSAHRSTASASGTNILYAWIFDGSVHVRIANNTNTFSTADVQLLAATATDDIAFVRLAPLGTGWAMAVRWENTTSDTAPGKIELYRVSSVGALMGPPVLITDKSDSSFDSALSFGMAARADGVSFVVWHVCGTDGDGNGCGVFGQIISAQGDLVGTPFIVPTTTLLDQRDPSVVALTDSFVVGWRDNSGTPPDTSGDAVRVRIVYVNPDGTID